MKTACIFDLDGTLVDSADEILGCMRDAMIEEGLTPPAKAERSWIGPPLHELIPKILPNATPQAAEAVVKRFMNKYDHSDYAKTPVFPGTPELLTELRTAGVATFIATNKRQIPATRVIEKLGLGPFLEIVCVDSLPGKRLKKAEMLAHLATKHKLDPAHTVMVGDTASDIEAGRQNSFSSVAILYGYGSLESLTASKPDAMAEDVAALQRLLRVFVQDSRFSGERSKR